MTINAMHIGGPHDGQVVMLSAEEPMWFWLGDRGPDTFGRGGTRWRGRRGSPIWQVPLVDTPDGYFLFWNEGKFV